MTAVSFFEVIIFKTPCSERKFTSCLWQNSMVFLLVSWQIYSRLISRSNKYKTLYKRAIGLKWQMLGLFIASFRMVLLEHTWCDTTFRAVLHCFMIGRDKLSRLWELINHLFSPGLRTIRKHGYDYGRIGRAEWQNFWWLFA